MITGKYVCLVTIDVKLEEDTEGIKSFEEFEDLFFGDGLTDEMRQIMFDEFGCEDGTEDFDVIKVFGHVMKE